MSVGIGGEVIISGVTAGAYGSFTASGEGNKFCFNSMNVSPVSLNYGNLNVSIGDLGFFDDFLELLTIAILGLCKGQVRTALSSALTPVIVEQLRKVMPLCESL